MILSNIINNYNSNLSFDDKSINDLVCSVFKAEKCVKASVNIILSKGSSLNQLKKKYLNIDQFTDVIAFNLEDDNEDIEGEVYISIDDVSENSKIYSVSFNHEFRRVLIHGILHLLGYDDKDADEIKIMRSLEEKYLLNSNKDIIFLK